MSNLPTDPGTLLAHYEAEIESGLVTAMTAMYAIKQQQLYRLRYPTFDDYLKVRWGLTRQHANRLAKAGGFILQVKHEAPDLPPPTSERAARPFARLPENERVEAYREAVEDIGAAPTSAEAETAIARREGTILEPIGFHSEAEPDAWRADTPAPTPPPKAAPPTVEDAKVKSEAIKESPPPPKPKPNLHEEEVRQLAYFKKAVPALVKYLTDGSSNLSSLIISINTINGGADFSTLSDFALAFECLSDRLLRGLRSTGDVRLAPPTTQDVADYAKSARLKDHAEDFCDFFDSNGWLVSGKTPMKDWKATYRRWCRNAPRFSNGQDAKAQRRTTEWV